MFPRFFLEMSGKLPGNVRKIAGKCPGNVREMFGKLSGKMSGECPGNCLDMHLSGAAHKLSAGLD